MPSLTVNGHAHFYEVRGAGPPLVLIHGAFVDHRMWDPQAGAFAARHRVVRYDLRGHGHTGPSAQARYSIAGLADDLAELLDALSIHRAAVCGLSLGGMIAQSFAVRFPDRIAALILCDTAVSVSLTLSDKLQTYILFPRWAMELTIRALSVRRFTRLSFWLARATRNPDWFGRDPATRQYVEDCMLAFPREEYIKVYGAIYGFRLQPLERITAPTLALNGEHESSSVFRHTREILRRVPGARAATVPGAGHTSNLENPEAFNRLVLSFLTESAA